MYNQSITCRGFRMKKQYNDISAIEYLDESVFFSLSYQNDLLIEDIKMAKYFGETKELFFKSLVNAFNSVKQPVNIDHDVSEKISDLIVNVESGTVTEVDFSNLSIMNDEFALELITGDGKFEVSFIVPKFRSSPQEINATESYDLKILGLSFHDEKKNSSDVYDYFDNVMTAFIRDYGLKPIYNKPKSKFKAETVKMMIADIEK